MRVVHVHIPKTAGTSVNKALSENFDRSRSMMDIYEPDLEGIDVKDFDFYAGHIGYSAATKLDAKLVCVLRDPVDRFLSVYYYWRQLYEREKRKQRGIVLAANLPLEEFVRRFDEPGLEEEFYNRMTWQLAHSHHLKKRQEISTDITYAQLLEKAMSHLETFSVVGFQSDMEGFSQRCEDELGLTLEIGQHNKTGERKSAAKLSKSVRRRIETWVELDIQLYERCLERWGP